MPNTTEKVQADEYRLSIPPRIWQRLEALPSQEFARLSQHLTGIVDLSTLSGSSSAMTRNRVCRFETKSAEIFFVIDEERRKVRVIDVLDRNDSA